jgi:ABC-type sugar transport system permease subunit
LITLQPALYRLQGYTSLFRFNFLTRHWKIFDMTTLVAGRPIDVGSPQTQRILHGLMLWRAAFGTALLLATLLLWISPTFSALAGWIRWLASVLLLAGGSASLAAVPAIRQRKHRGRTLSLVVDYLGLIACLLAALHLMRVFVGIDALAGTFGRGLPYLLISFVGYLVGAFGDRYEDSPRRQRGWRRAGNIIIATGFVLFFYFVDGLRGLLFLVTQLLNPLPLSLIFAAIVFMIALWAMWRRPTAEAMHAKAGQDEMLNGWLFLSPNLLGFLIFFAGPLLLSLYFSFTDSDAVRPPNWVGLSNYARILNLTIQPLATATQSPREVFDITVYSELTRFALGNRNFVIGAEDRLFWIALRNTLVFALIAIPLSVIPALTLANVLNSKLPGMKIFRAAYFLPSIAAVIGIALVWQWLYNSTIGYINYFILLGIEFLNSTFGLALVDPKIQWVSNSQTALLSVIIVFAWQTMGFNSVLFLAGLQNIPREIYEAATVDGAGRWSRFLRITIPLLAPTTFFVVTTTSIQAMQIFEQIFIMINPPEGPNNSTVSLVLYLYRSGFQNFRQGYAPAIAWVLFLVIFGLTLLRFQRERAEG